MTEIEGMQPGSQPLQPDHATRATEGATIATSEPTRRRVSEAEQRRLVEKALREFVEDGRSLSDRSEGLGMPRGTLKSRSARESWVVLRARHLENPGPAPSATRAMGDYAGDSGAQGHRVESSEKNELSLNTESSEKNELSRAGSNCATRAQPATQPDDPADATVAAAMLAAIRESRVPAIRTIRDLQVAQSIYHKAIGRDRAGPGGGARAVNVFLLGHATPATLPAGTVTDAELIP